MASYEMYYPQNSIEYLIEPGINTKKKLEELKAEIIYLLQNIIHKQRKKIIEQNHIKLYVEKVTWHIAYSHYLEKIQPLMSFLNINWLITYSFLDKQHQDNSKTKKENTDYEIEVDNLKLNLESIVEFINVYLV